MREVDEDDPKALLAIAIERLRKDQADPELNSEENEQALMHCNLALGYLEER